MLKIINTKLLIAILATLTVLGALLLHISRTSARSTQILQQQQDDADAVRKHDEETKAFIRQQRQKTSAYPANGSKTLDHYIP